MFVNENNEKDIGKTVNGVNENINIIGAERLFLTVAITTDYLKKLNLQTAYHLFGKTLCFYLPT
jgi:hypothetical protein